MITRRHLVGLVLAATASPAGAQIASEPDVLRLATGASGGTFFDYGAGLAKLVESKAKLRVVAMPSGGSIENMRRIEDGSADLALVAMGPAFEAWNASAAPWTGKPPLKRARALLPMYETPFHLATTEASGLKTVRDLDGKRVGVGPKRGANEQIFLRLSEGLNMTTDLVFGDPGELADKVISREVDAIFFGAGARRRQEPPSESSRRGWSFSSACRYSLTAARRRRRRASARRQSPCRRWFGCAKSESSAQPCQSS